MKDCRVIRKAGNSHAITIPSEYLTHYNIQTGDLMMFTKESNGIKLIKVRIEEM